MHHITCNCWPSNSKQNSSETRPSHRTEIIQLMIMHNSLHPNDQRYEIWTVNHYLLALWFCTIMSWCAKRFLKQVTPGKVTTKIKRALSNQIGIRTCLQCRLVRSARNAHTVCSFVINTENTISVVTFSGRMFPINVKQEGNAESSYTFTLGHSVSHPLPFF